MEKLTELGHCFGYVFQLRDDLKDYLSAQEEEGKAVHADIRAGYYTMPLLRALHTEQGNQIRALLQEAQTGTDAEAEAKLRQVLSFVRGTDAFSYTKKRIDAYAARGPSLLSECPDMEAAGLIGELMTWLTKSIAA